ncbi:clathrin-coat assembly protein [Babesia caballi]|uniref:Clathrin-coat assembly protein n=1 Tax=Babesia caballi TaxID=5871 RepID=A0AAV4LLT7_BABCB|nr:clathrin-coat assembly protein [Babesia caballi]
MSKEEGDLPSYLSNKVVFHYGTVQRSVDEAEAQSCMQHNGCQPMSYEVINFDNGPLPFDSIVFVPPGDHATLRIEGKATQRFRSLSDTLVSQGDVAVFARVVLEDGARRYVALCLMDTPDSNWLTYVYEVDEDSDFTPMVDGLLLAVRVNCVSYVLVRRRERGCAWAMVPEEDCMYYGDHVLDAIASLPAFNAVKSLVGCKPAKTDLEEQNVPLSHLRRYTDSATCKTLFELREATVCAEREERQIQHLHERLEEFLEPEIDAHDFDDLKDLFMECYRHTKFVFSDKIPLNEMILPAVEQCILNLCFDDENPYFGILQVLVRDCNVAHRLMFEMDFGRTLVDKLIDASSSRWIEREQILDLLIEMVSHGNCMRKYLQGDGPGKGDSLCDTLMLGTARLHRFSMINIRRRMEALGQRVDLFFALSHVEELFRSLEPKLDSAAGPEYEDLEQLLHRVNEAIAMVRQHHTGKVRQSMLTDTREVRQYTVSYIMETKLARVLTGLMRALVLHLERFPVAPLYIDMMLERPLWLVAQYTNLIDFGDCLLYMADICDFVNGMALNSALQSGIYANSRAVYCKKRCQRMAIHTILLKMASTLLGKRSCPQIVSAMHRICSEYPCGLVSLPTVLAEQSVIQAVLHIINSAVEDLKSSGTSSEDPRENMELWQILNLVCRSLVSDESGRLLYVVGKKLIVPLGGFLKMFVPDDKRVVDLDLQPLQELRENLRRLFTSHALLRPTKAGLLFENVNIYLRDLLKSANVELHPDTLKQSFAKASHMHEMSRVNNKLRNSVFLADPELCRTMPRSMVTEQFGTVYSVSDETVELIDVHWCPKKRYDTRAEALGVPEKKAGHYRTCRLYVAPPEALPEHVKYGIRLLSFASTLDQYINVFAELLRQRENSETVMRLWVHAVASISPHMETLLNVEMGAFKSLVGYEWFFASEDAIPVITHLAKVMYAALHHMSSDRHCYEATDEQRRVTGAPLRYTNDDLLTLVVLSVSGVMIARRWSIEGRIGRASRRCLKWLCKLMSYWYLRFQKSQGYLMNKLMGWYTSLPRMADGAALLIVSCGPVINPNCVVDVVGCYSRENDETDEECEISDWEDDRETDSRRCTRVMFEGREYTVALREKELVIDEDVPNAAFWGLIRRLEALKVPMFAEFMCAVASRCYSANPCTLTLAGEIAHLLIASDAPIMAFLSAVADRCVEECTKAWSDATLSGNVSGKAYRVLSFWALVAKALVSNDVVGPVEVLRVNYWILDFFNRYAKACKSISEGCCRALFEGYVHLFKCHNKLWEGHNAALTRISEFNNYMQLINGAVCWICQVLNGCKAKDTETMPGEPGAGGMTKLTAVDFDDERRLEAVVHLSWETVLAGFLALKHAFKIPFTALNILYTVLSGPMELIVKIINKQIDSEIIKVTPSTALWLHNIVRQLCDALLQHSVEETYGGLSSDAPLQLLILQLLHDVCASIHQTGPSQDVFIYALVYGTTHAPEADLLAAEARQGPSHSDSAQRQEDIYSDLMVSTKSRVQRKLPANSLARGAAGNSAFHGITCALESFRDNVSAELARGRAKKLYEIALSSQVANVLLLLNAFEALSQAIAKDAMERTPPKSLPGYIFLKPPSHSKLFRHSLGDAWSTDGRDPSSTRSVLARAMRMTRCEDWSANTCLVNQSVPSPLSAEDRRQLRWLSRCFLFNGSREAVEMWKAVRYLATAKLVFADELMQFAPIKTKRIERPPLSDGARHIRSVSTRAPSKHVDAYESEKAGASAEEGVFSQENIEKAVAQLNGMITSQTWQDFDNDLVTNGLNLRSILMNPGLLRDYSARATFLNALSRHVLIKELLVAVGVDVRPLRVTVARIVLHSFVPGRFNRGGALGAVCARRWLHTPVARVRRGSRAGRFLNDDLRRVSAEREERHASGQVVGPQQVSCSACRYGSFSQAEKKRIADRIYAEVALRDVRWVNFFDLEGRKVVYRKYAGVVISIYADREDNTLAYHEFIHLIVEILDAFYGNVREMDVICNFNTLHSLLNELILAGELLETSKQAVLERLKATYKLN